MTATSEFSRHLFAAIRQVDLGQYDRAFFHLDEAELMADAGREDEDEMREAIIAVADYVIEMTEPTGQGLRSYLKTRALAIAGGRTLPFSLAV